MIVASSVILNVASVLVRWVPIRMSIVDETEQGVRWWRGKATKLIKKPDFYFYVPWIGRLDVECVVTQEVEAQAQCVTMSDGKSRSFSVGLQYEVFDLLLKLTKVDDFDDSLLNLVQRVAAKVLRRPNIEDPDKAILGLVRSRVEKWGVKVTALGLINDTLSRPIHLFTEESE